MAAAVQAATGGLGVAGRPLAPVGLPEPGVAVRRRAVPSRRGTGKSSRASDAAPPPRWTKRERSSPRSAARASATSSSSHSPPRTAEAPAPSSSGAWSGAYVPWKARSAAGFTRLDARGGVEAEPQRGVHGDGDGDQPGPPDPRRVERLDGEVERGGMEPGADQERRRNRDALRLVAQLVGGDEEDLSLAPHGRLGTTLLRGRYVIRRKLRALAEEELLRLLEEDLVGLRVARGKAVLVQDHLEVLEPHLPGLLGDGVEDALTELVREGLERHARQFLPELLAVDRACHPESSRAGQEMSEAGVDAERLGERLEGVERRGALPALQHRDVGDREPGLAGQRLLGELPAEPLRLEVGGELVGERGGAAILGGIGHDGVSNIGRTEGRGKSAGRPTRTAREPG